MTPRLPDSDNVRMIGGDPPPTLPPAPEETSQASFVTRMWPRRRTWIVLGRTLGGFGAFIAALIAAAQFAFGGEDPDDGNGDGGSSTPYVFTARRDQSGAIGFEAPTAWGNVNGSGWVASSMGVVADGTPLGPKLQASPNIESWSAPRELETPGVFVGMSELLAERTTPRELAERFSYAKCNSDRSVPYHRGELDGWEARSSCPGTKTRWVTVVVTSTDNPGALVFVQAKLVGERDTAAFDRILATLDLG